MSGTDRPRLHLAPRTGWLNDPLALSWHDDRYHLFFQHVPDGVAWAAHCRWGRATSTDLLRWQEQPVALAPAPDEVGAWSGCLVEGTLLYTSVGPGDVERGRVRVARPAGPGWARWEPGEVVVPPPDDPAVTTFRDPFVVRDGDRWRMLLGAGLADGTGCALGYVSGDLRSWEYDRVVAARHTSERDPVWTGAIWECPQLVRFPDGDVLVFSSADPGAPGEVVAAVGRWHDGRFDVDSWQALTAGTPYAASVFADREGRTGLVAWLRGVAGDGWAGAVSTPVRLSLDLGRLRLDVLPDLAALRRVWDDDAPTWELQWRPQGTLHLGAAALRAEPGGLVVSSAAGEVTASYAGGPVTVLRDGPVLEVLTGEQLVGAVVGPGPLRPGGRGWSGWSLG